jgi:hypothetical protein
MIAGATTYYSVEGGSVRKKNVGDLVGTRSPHLSLCVVLYSNENTQKTILLSDTSHRKMRFQELSLRHLLSSTEARWYKKHVPRHEAVRLRKEKGS